MFNAISDLHYQIIYFALLITVWCRRSTGRSVISPLDNKLDIEPWQNTISVHNLDGLGQTIGESCSVIGPADPWPRGC